MHTRNVKVGNTDFETWARQLICRKVPDNYHHLINAEVVHDGAAILKRGEAFEVRVRDGSAYNQILVTPFPDAFIERHLLS